MSEKFRGTSFSEWTYVPGEISNGYYSQLAELAVLGRFLIGILPIPPGDIANAGNLSFRTEKGCVITRSGCSIKHLDPEDLVEVIGWDEPAWKPTCRSPAPNEPSSETGAHLAIYKARPEANVIVHLHSQEMVAWAVTIGAAMTQQEFPYGTLEFVREIIRVLKQHDIVCLCGPEHIGFFALGRDFKQVKQAIEQALAKIAESRSHLGSVATPPCRS
ncbi:MAG: class II aldolase/adducin family protein [Patescibacteria group bacterium]